MIPRCKLQRGITQPILRLFWHICSSSTGSTVHSDDISEWMDATKQSSEQEVISGAIYAERDFFVSLRIKVASRRRLIRRCRRRRRCRLYVRRASLPPGPRVPPLLRLLYITFSLYYTIGSSVIFSVLRRERSDERSLLRLRARSHTRRASTRRGGRGRGRPSLSMNCIGEL